MSQLITSTSQDADSTASTGENTDPGHSFFYDLRRGAAPIPSGNYRVIIQPGSVRPIQMAKVERSIERGASLILVIAGGDFVGQEIDISLKEKSAYKAVAIRDRSNVVALANIAGVDSADDFVDLLNRIAAGLYPTEQNPDPPIAVARIHASTDDRNLTRYELVSVTGGESRGGE